MPSTRRNDLAGLRQPTVVQLQPCQHIGTIAVNIQNPKLAAGSRGDVGLRPSLPPGPHDLQIRCRGIAAAGDQRPFIARLDREDWDLPHGKPERRPCERHAPTPKNRATVARMMIRVSCDGSSSKS